MPELVSGVTLPDSGSLTRNGEPLALKTPDDARRAGIFRVYQEQSLIGGYPVMQNLFLGPRSDMEQIAEAVRRIQAHAAELVKA